MTTFGQRTICEINVLERIALTIHEHGGLIVLTIRRLQKATWKDILNKKKSLGFQQKAERCMQGERDDWLLL
jgi:hypothetical protein